LLFIKHFTPQGGEGGAQLLRFVDDILRRTAIGRHIRQTSRGDHSSGNGLLSLEESVQPFTLLRMTQGGDMAKANAFAIGFLKLQTSSTTSALTGAASSGRRAASNPSVRLSCQSASGSSVILANGAQPKRVSATAFCSRISAMSAVSGSNAQAARAIR
jgi:hypothetical protein